MKTIKEKQALNFLPACHDSDLVSLKVEVDGTVVYEATDCPMSDINSISLNKIMFHESAIITLKKK